MAELFVVNTRKLDLYDAFFKKEGRALPNRAFKVVRSLTRQGVKYLEQYHTQYSDRSLGKLRSNVEGVITKGILSSSGVIRTKDNEQTRHKYMIEYGTKGGQLIRAKNRYMKVPESSWNKASGNASIQRLKKGDGYYYFTSVKRGKFKGFFPHKKTFTRLDRYAKRHLQGFSRMIFSNIVSFKG